jgi:hypothetical protein
MIQQNQPQRFEWRNFRRKFRTRAIGDIHLIEVEVDAETWQQLDTMPKDADGEMVIWWATRGDGVGKEKKAKGEHGAFWAKMVKSSAYDCRDLQQWLSVESREAVHDALRVAFGVESLTFVPPAEAVAKFEQSNLPGVAAIARRLGESEAK